jgi:single-stranded-DNA-specific exonuclease
VSRQIRRRESGDSSTLLRAATPVLAQIYANRGLHDESELELKLERLIPPNQLKGLDAAATLLADSIEKQLAITVVGDFDADGATSTALALSVLRSLGHSRVDFLVPNRFEFGYGLTPEIVDLAAAKKPDLIITVDNGISSIEGVNRARELGIKTLITDHHLAGRQLPEADVIVNPNQPGCKFPSKNLAGVGVIFYVMLALRSELRSRKWFEQQGMTEPGLGEVLDLVALGTVADVVPLDYNNRILVQQGLLRIRAGRARPGIAALLDIAGRNATRLVATDLGFAVGPRLNAAGRLDDMSVGIACLLAENTMQAASLAEQLDGLNKDRQQIEKGMQAEAMKLLEKVLQADEKEVPAALCLYDGSWHQGVVGILASRVKDKMHRPTIAFADGGTGEVKGSARSIQGLHIRDALDAVATKNPGMISKFGGHAMAAGLSLPLDQLDSFRDAFVAEVAMQLDVDSLQAIVDSDGELPAAEMNLQLARELRYAGPWGQHFPEPTFDGEFQLVHQRIVGERHLKLVLAHADKPELLIDAIAFNIDTEVWPNTEVEKVNIAYRLDVNEYRGRESVQLMVEHVEAI